jgi:uncharacterized protein (DUF433 family)
MTAASYTPQEAAVMSGAPLTLIQKTISARKMPARVEAVAKRRRLDETAVLAFALAEALPEELHVSPEFAYRLLRDAPAGDGGVPDELVIGRMVRIDTGAALAAARQRLALYERARKLIVSDPAIMGGTPVICGTRITARSILGRIESGDSIESILEDYPYLDRDAVEAAALYAKANPSRGRPAGRLWRHAS